MIRRKLSTVLLVLAALAVLVPGLATVGSAIPLPDPIVLPAAQQLTSETDYTLSFDGQTTSGPLNPSLISPSNPLIFTWTLTLDWQGTLGGAPFSPASDSVLLMVFNGMWQGDGTVGGSSPLASAIDPASFTNTIANSVTTTDPQHTIDPAFPTSAIGVPFELVEGPQEFTFVWRLEQAWLSAGNSCAGDCSFIAFQSGFIVPEPGTLALCGLGLIGLAIAGRDPRAGF